LMSSFSSLPGLKYGTFFGGTSTLSPVLGLRPLRGSRWRRRKLPKPRNSIFSPRCRASMMLVKTVSTISSECFLVRSETRETSSTSSALVIGFPRSIRSVGSNGSIRSAGRAGLPGRDLIDPTDLPDPLDRASALEPDVIPERGLAGATALLVRLPVRPVLVGLQRPDAQPDLPLGGAELDDLHLVGLADHELDLLLTVRVVELRHMDQAFDAFVELDERAEVGHAHDLALDDGPHVVT